MNDLDVNDEDFECRDTRTAAEGTIELTVNLPIDESKLALSVQQLASTALSYRRARKSKASTSVLCDAPESLNAAWYGRFSSTLQRNESLDDQKRKCQDAATLNSHTIRIDLEFTDEAVSGTLRDRDGLNKMLAAAERGEIDVLYIYSMSRLARESVITLPLLKRLVFRYGVRVIVPTEGIDTAREGWELLATLLAATSERYIADLSNNTLRGQEGVVLGGLHSVGDWCFGYSSIEASEDTGLRSNRNRKPRMTYVINPTHAEWVRKIFYWYVRERRSLKWIVTELNRANAPKDHRSTSREWHHALVINVLSNPKYIGYWAWGKMKNERDPETGIVRQVERDESEIEKYGRELPHLRIVENDLFADAQTRLRESAQRFAKNRNNKGRIQGSTSESNGRTSKRLLSEMTRCSACGSPFRYVGNKMTCRGFTRGTCQVRTTLDTDLAESMLLRFIGNTCLQNEAWLQALYEGVLTNYRELRSQVPTTLSTLEGRRSELMQRITNLLNLLEQGDPSPDINGRLTQRRQELNELDRGIAQLRSSVTYRPEVPTLKWVRAQLSQLNLDLNESGSAANAAIRKLIPNGIQLEECKVPHRNRKFLRGTFQLPLKGVYEYFGYSFDADQASVPEAPITIDFVNTEFASNQRAMVQQLYDQGMLCRDIAKRMDINPSRVTAILHDLYAHRGEPKPDGNARRYMLARKADSPQPNESHEGTPSPDGC